MARFRGVAQPGARLRTAAWLLAALNLGLLAWAVVHGGAEIRDGSGSVTNGWLVAAGIGVTILVAVLVPLLPLTPLLVTQAQVYALGAQALHATGHLARWYYVFPYYDDLLHFGLVFAIGLLLYSFTRSRQFLFTRRLGPRRVGLLIWFLATAAAGFWEIFEFLMDLGFGTREQDNLFDTMLDMVDGTLGGALAGVLATRAVHLERHAQRLADAHSDELLD